MLAAEGNIACSFNSTVYHDTLKYVPELVKWAQEHIDIVHTMVFILFRYITPSLPYDFYAGDKKIVFDDIHYHSDNEEVTNLRSEDAVTEIRKVFPDFKPAAFLNGTHKADDFKWLLSERIGTKDKIFGFLNDKFLEMVMTFNHVVNDRYLSYASPKTSSLGRATLLNLWIINKSIRTALKKYLKFIGANPFKIFKKVHLQSILIIQPVDFMPNGDQSMCDGCPDITYWKDENGKEQLVWSCRLEEPMKYGEFLHTVPRKEGFSPTEVRTN